MKKVWNRLRGHFQENVARYATIATAVLTPAAGLLGTLAANLGGADTQAGRYVIGAASAIGFAITAVTFIRNLGIWQMLDEFGTAPGALPKVTTQITKPIPTGGEPPSPASVAEVDELTQEPSEPDGDDQVHEATDGDPDEVVEEDPEVADA